MTKKFCGKYSTQKIPTSTNFHVFKNFPKKRFYSLAKKAHRLHVSVSFKFIGDQTTPCRRKQSQSCLFGTQRHKYVREKKAPYTKVTYSGPNFLCGVMQPTTYSHPLIHADIELYIVDIRSGRDFILHPNEGLSP